MKKNGNLDSKHQKYLTHCIVELYAGNGKMSNNEMKEWSYEIHKTFPKERPVVYHKYFI